MNEQEKRDTARNLKYVPKKYHERVDVFELDEDGWWIYLKDGWCCDPATHTIHEDTKARAIEELRDTRACECCDACVDARIRAAKWDRAGTVVR